MPQHTIDEGFNPQTGIRTKVHFEDGEMIVQKTFDAQPLLDYAKSAREATEGQRWGDGRVIGTLPPAVFGRISLIKDPDERDREIMRFFRENPAFVTFEKVLKV
jgi:hypothetical protein